MTAAAPARPARRASARAGAAFQSKKVGVVRSLSHFK